jgi:O-methyltransferase
MLNTVRAICRALARRIRRHPPQSFPADFNAEDIAIINRVQPYTYSTPERTAALCNAVRYVATNNIPGAIVECGVWRGGSSMAAMLVLLSKNEVSRDFYLYDTYEGQSEPSAEDVNIMGISAREKWASITGAGEKMTYASLEDVKAAVGQIGYPSERIQYVVGKVEETIPAVAPKEIAFVEAGHGLV